MFYKLYLSAQQQLRSIPETGMGYQIITGRPRYQYREKEYIVLNSELAIENDIHSTKNLREIFSKGYDYAVRTSSTEDIIIVGLQNKSLNLSERKQISGAKDNPVIYPDDKTYFVRLSAYDDDRRIDKINNCLLPGSYTTTKKDYEKCVNDKDDPVERYALPNDEVIEWAFHILPEKADGYRFGIVQAEFGKLGGGEECLFDNGTSNNTFKKQTKYGVFYP